MPTDGHRWPQTGGCRAVETAQAGCALSITAETTKILTERSVGYRSVTPDYLTEWPVRAGGVGEVRDDE